jgi:hypothetical protein
MFAKRLVAAQSCGGENQSKENLPRSPEPKACLKRAHPRTAPPEANGRFVRSSAFTRQKVVNIPNRLKAELQTGAVRGCTRQVGGGPLLVDNRPPV